jgi:5-methyltetrahydrofolate--homocysteine methyltransferase
VKTVFIAEDKMESIIFVQLKKAILEYKADEAKSLAEKAMAEKIDPLTVMDAMTEAIRDVGEGFGRGELFLPELMGSAEAMQAAMPIIEEAIRSSGANRKSLGKVVLGTVFGDMHNIGKAMVSTLFTAAGFEVIDLGINVKKEIFIEAIKEHEAHILAMSALLTTTAQEAKAVIDALKEQGLREQVKIMVGGGAISEEFAAHIGAEGYEPTAPGAVELAKQFMGLN